jgi:hypothetical protein
MEEKRFIDDSVKNNQLTSSNSFVDEVEQRIGLRVERRGRGTPGNKNKCVPFVRPLSVPFVPLF